MDALCTITFVKLLIRVPVMVIVAVVMTMIVTVTVTVETKQYPQCGFEVSPDDGPISPSSPSVAPGPAPANKWARAPA